MPVMIDAFLESAALLAESLESMEKNCISGIEICEDKMCENATKSLMVAAALNTHIGYENAAAVAKKAHANGGTLKEAGVELGLFTEAEYDEWIDLLEMTGVK